MKWTWKHIHEGLQSLAHGVAINLPGNEGELATFSSPVQGEIQVRLTDGRIFEIDVPEDRAIKADDVVAAYRKAGPRRGFTQAEKDEAWKRYLALRRKIRESKDDEKGKLIAEAAEHAQKWNIDVSRIQIDELQSENVKLAAEVGALYLEVKMLHRALGNATRAVEEEQWAALGTVNEAVQPLVDAFMTKIRAH